MLCRDGFLKLLLLTGFLGVAIAFRVAAQSPQGGNSKDINALLTERRDVLAKLVEFLNRRVASGDIGLEAVYRAEDDLLGAELELAKTRDERLAALNSQLETSRLREDYARRQYEAGTAELEESLSATARRLQAEIQLLREAETEHRGAH